MKVIMVLENLRFGGRERRMLELLKGFSTYRNVNCTIVLLKDFIEYDTSEISFPIVILTRKIKKDPCIFLKLFHLFRKIKPDIVHSWGGMSSIYALPVAKLLGIKTVNAMITNAPDSIAIGSSLWIRFHLSSPFSDKILANSAAGIKSYHVKDRKAIVIHNGFDFKRVTKLTSSEEIRNQFNIKSTHIIGMVGSLDKRKDFRTFIDAAIRLLQKRPDLCFLIVGDGCEYLNLYNLIPTKLRDYIIFTGKQSNTESIINAFSIGVLTTYTEGISNTIMEYMALGKPVVATNSGGTPELVKDSETGYLIDKGDSLALCEKIEYLLDNPQKALQMGNLGKKRILEHFPETKMVKSHYDLYKSLIYN